MRSVLSLGLVLGLMISTSIGAYGADKGNRPKLVVVLSYDQMRGDYPSSFARFAGSRGFARVAHDGTWFTKCYYDHATLTTAPGHATLLTGCYPWKTGITNNQLCDTDGLGCVESTHDEEHGESPNHLLVPTVGDVLRKKDPASKVVGVALKDRAAIMMSGHRPTAVLWFDTKALRFTSSDYYPSIPWLGELHSTIVPARWQGAVWKAGIPTALDPAVDDQAVEGTMTDGRRTFPYTLPDTSDHEAYTWDYLRTPYSVRDLFAAATLALKRERLGRDDHTDILSIGISSTDVLGHTFGPDSREVQEMYVACDSILGSFIDTLDARVGRKNYMLVITADHGVAPIPELLQAQTVPGRPPVFSGRMKRKELTHILDSAMSARFQRPGAVWITEVNYPSIYLNTGALDSMGIGIDAAADAMVDALRSIPQIAYAVTRRDVLAGRRPVSINVTFFDRIRRSVHPERSGDVILYPAQYWIFGSTPATHGTPYDYDRYVPLMVMGGGFTGPTSDASVAPVDIAPTIARILGLDDFLTGVDGKPLPVSPSNVPKKKRPARGRP